MDRGWRFRVKAVGSIRPPFLVLVGLRSLRSLLNRLLPTSFAAWLSRVCGTGACAAVVFGLPTLVSALLMARLVRRPKDRGFRKWCGAHYTETGIWQPGTPGPTQVYHLGRRRVSPFDGDPDTLARETCAPSVCVRPRLVKR